MNSQTRKTLRRFLANRTAVVAAGTAGFLIGAGGFAAAQQGADDFAPISTPVATIDDTIVETTTDSTVATTDVTPTSIDLSIPTTVDDGTSTSLPSIDDNTSTSIDDNTSTSIDDNTSTSIDDNTSTSIDDNTSTSIDDIDDNTSTSIDDDNTSTSLPVALPAPFTETYQSSGGSISVSWSGTAFSINSISPAAGFAAEIEDNSWDKIRVDFENGESDARIEVRLNDGQLRVRID